jgi:hypothetical protein
MSQLLPETPPDYDTTRIIERPNGFFWQSTAGGEEFGPFPTLLEAVQDMQYRDRGTLEPGENLEEAQAELGIEDWFDPDTGAPAGRGVPRLEDH